jgi:hypothetical protein
LAVEEVTQTELGIVEGLDQEVQTPHLEELELAEKEALVVMALRNILHTLNIILKARVAVVAVELLLLEQTLQQVLLALALQMLLAVMVELDLHLLFLAHPQLMAVVAVEALEELLFLGELKLLGLVVLVVALTGQQMALHLQVPQQIAVVVAEELGLEIQVTVVQVL